MKEYICSTMILFLLSSTVYLNAQEHHSSQSKEIELDRGQRIEITSKYGDITVKEHDKNTVLFNFDVRTTGKDAEQALKLNNRVSLHFIESPTTVRMECMLSKNSTRNSVWKFFRDVDPFNHDNVNISIEVRVPKGQEIEINAKYCDLLLEASANNYDITQGHSNTRINSSIEELKYDGSFSELICENVREADIHMDFGRIDIYRCEKLDLVSTGSEIGIAHVDEIEIKSVRDEFNFKSIGIINSTSSMSTYEINELEKSALFDMLNGSLEIDEISSDFKDLTIDERRAEIDLTFSNHDFELDIKYEETQFSFPKSMSGLISNTGSIDEDDRFIEYNTDKDLSLVKIIGYRGEINIY